MYFKYYSYICVRNRSNKKIKIMNTEIQKLFVNHEIAAKLNSLGFDSPCLTTWQPKYNKPNEWVLNSINSVDLHNEEVQPNSHKSRFTGYLNSYPTHYGLKYISAPTLEQVINWLEEKHQIFIEIGVDCTTYPKFCYSVNKFVGNPKDLTEKEWEWQHPKPDNWFLHQTRNEALEEAIKFALTLI